MGEGAWLELHLGVRVLEAHLGHELRGGVGGWVGEGDPQAIRQLRGDALPCLGRGGLRGTGKGMGWGVRTRKENLSLGGG